MPVLVVDDDAEIRDLVRIVLESAGYAVLAAADGGEALALLASVRPRLVLLDMRMPVLDGWGVAREIRFRGYDTPVIIMTSDPDIQKVAGDLGAQGFVRKPFRVDQLLEAVRGVVASE